MKTSRILFILLVAFFINGCGDNFFTPKFPVGSYVKVKITEQKGMIVRFNLGDSYYVRVKDGKGGVDFYEGIELERYNNPNKI